MIHQVEGTVHVAAVASDIQKGDRFLTKDPRSEGRVVEVREVLPGDRFRVVTEVNPLNPSAVNNRRIPISGKTLRTRYTKISH